MSHRRHNLNTKGKGRHQGETVPQKARPAGAVKPIISKQKFGKPMNEQIIQEMAAIRRGCTVFGIVAGAACLIIFLLFAATCHAQTEYYSPFSVVIAKEVTDIYHTPVHVVITDKTISIGVDAEGGQKFNRAIQGREDENDNKTRYIISDGIVLHERTPKGERVTWITDKFQWALFSFQPDFFEVINEK